MQPKTLLATMLTLLALLGSGCTAPSLADMLVATAASAAENQQIVESSLPQPTDGDAPGRAGIAPY